MKPNRGDAENAHVMWLGPSNGGDGSVLKQVCLLVQQALHQSGFLVDNRELKLHCTIINTIYRKPSSRGPRIPFSYPAILASSAFQRVSQVQGGGGTSSHPLSQSQNNRNHNVPVDVDFGSWDVDEIQVCKMGSWGPEGEYVSVGGISLG
ncbi:hypothetical protein JAAARDRAFT_42860 [Jaapia argillacea MUCL 33604]|uniref:A-kinase anchor protein 7-like phosphoesterase domain-containing protein n=1 Tax=Jaapia argillacea MUCL 33604 TaxID=933084 RepID=A0A067P6T9_9AGAM|nr:hypothetical protein JAAARDRAFT_42860 [Jaapia argillacea MUCL 33604]